MVFLTLKNYNVLDLSPNTTYYFYYIVINLFGASSPSSVSIFATMPGIITIIMPAVNVLYNLFVVFCGDGVCDKNNRESCSSCSFDCGTCGN